MNPYIITLIGIAILGPVLYFAPSNLTHKGKWAILLASFIIAEMGVLTLNFFPYWQAAGILMLLIVLTSYLLHNRANSIFIDSAEMELAVAREKSEEPRRYGANKGSLSNVSFAKSETVLDEGSSNADQQEHSMVNSNGEESKIGPLEAGFTPVYSANLEQENILPGESVELDVADLIAQDNSESIIKSRVEADVIEYIEEAEEEQFRGSLAVSELMPELSTEESKTFPGGSKQQEEDEFYLATIERMLELEEEDIDDIDPLGTHPKLYDSTVIKQTRIAVELESFADELQGEPDDLDSKFTLSQSSSSTVENDPDNKVSVHADHEELPEKEQMGIDKEEDEVLCFSELQELNSLIIDSLKFAKFDMDSDSYISLLEKQLEKELPIKMKYEILLMLMNAYFKAGQYSQSKNLIEEMKLEFGHLPAISLELEILFANVNKMMH